MHPKKTFTSFYSRSEIYLPAIKLRNTYLLIFIIGGFAFSAPGQAQQKNDTIPAGPVKTSSAPGPEIELPLKLLEFSGRPVNDIVVFKWSTTAEINVNHFELEKSINDISFTTINKQTAKGISNNPDAYKAEDFKPATGINYYRLKFVCNNGKFSYSKTIKVKF